jgi:hypothetical protein
VQVAEVLGHQYLCTQQNGVRRTAIGAGIIHVVRIDAHQQYLLAA